MNNNVKKKDEGSGIRTRAASVVCCDADHYANQPGKQRIN